MKARPCQTSAKRTSRSKSPRRRLRVQLLARARRSVRLWTTAAVDGQNKGTRRRSIAQATRTALHCAPLMGRMDGSWGPLRVGPEGRLADRRLAASNAGAAAGFTARGDLGDDAHLNS